MSKSNPPKNRGSLHHLAKLDEAKVRAIRAKYAEGGTTYQQLAEEFSISKPAIVRIMSNNPACRTWKHVR